MIGNIMFLFCSPTIILLFYNTSVEGNDTILVTISPVTVTSKPAGGTTPVVPTYPLPPGGLCVLHIYLFTSRSWEFWLLSIYDYHPKVCLFSHFLVCTDECWSPLGVQTLPASSFSASSQQTGHPPEAGRLHWWDPHSDLQVHQDDGFI